MRAEPEVRHSSSCDAGLVDVAGAKIQSGADPECVVLAADRSECLELDVDGEVGVPAIVAQQMRVAAGVYQPQSEITVVVDIGNGNVARAARAQVRGNDRRAIDKLSQGVVAEKEERRRILCRPIGGSADQKIDPAIVVEVE